MDGFSGYNQIQICHTNQYNTTFTTPWGMFVYQVMPFGLKNGGDTFQRAMNYIFHDLAHLILAYLDNLTVWSKKRYDHLKDLRLVFQWCRQYNLCLNLLKCIFNVIAWGIIGFIVSQQGIKLYPLKVPTIKEVPPPRILKQLQSL